MAADSTPTEAAPSCVAARIAATLPGRVAIIAGDRLRDFTALILVAIFMNSFEVFPWRSW